MPVATATADALRKARADAVAVSISIDSAHRKVVSLPHPVTGAACAANVGG